MQIYIQSKSDFRICQNESQNLNQAYRKKFLNLEKENWLCINDA